MEYMEMKQLDEWTEESDRTYEGADPAGESIFASSGTAFDELPPSNYAENKEQNTEQSHEQAPSQNYEYEDMSLQYSGEGVMLGSGSNHPVSDVPTSRQLDMGDNVSEQKEEEEEDEAEEVVGQGYGGYNVLPLYRLDTGQYMANTCYTVSQNPHRHLTEIRESNTEQPPNEQSEEANQKFNDVYDMEDNLPERKEEEEEKGVEEVVGQDCGGYNDHYRLDAGHYMANACYTSNQLPEIEGNNAEQSSNEEADINHSGVDMERRNVNVDTTTSPPKLDMGDHTVEWPCDGDPCPEADPYSDECYTSKDTSGDEERVGFGCCYKIRDRVKDMWNKMKTTKGLALVCGLLVAAVVGGALLAISLGPEGTGTTLNKANVHFTSLVPPLGLTSFSKENITTAFFLTSLGVSKTPEPFASTGPNIEKSATTVTVIDINECTRNQCQHGRCENKDGGYKCTCSPGWTGQNCQRDINECTRGPCHHGRCENEDGGYSCSCSTGWTGQNCEHGGPALTVYIGLKNGKWTDGSQLSYTNWAPGEPNGKALLSWSHSHCAVIFTRNGKDWIGGKERHKGEWVDYRCDFAKPYICKAPK
uniref:C-type lectin domain-containing protein n=1 Tax=Branchiostoma floridae TaxID=7739 RepID=C3XPC6_BRAFL|eukprot:XP_002613788.1 hypothetical protein BRAFLDRAFT_85329 [Branchiostoma floridae]